ncbi:hypothetical protein COP2_035378 [Malus domestica]
MTRSSQPVRAHILEFDDDFERTLRRKRKQPEPNHLVLVLNLNQKLKLKRNLEKNKTWLLTIEQSRNFQPWDWTMPCLFAFNTLQ